MSKRFDSGLSVGELADIRDEDIDLSDIPELTEEFFAKARLSWPPPTERVTVELSRSALDAFKARGEDYGRLMRAVLEKVAVTLAPKG